MKRRGDSAGEDLRDGVGGAALSDWEDVRAHIVQDEQQVAGHRVQLRLGQLRKDRNLTQKDVARLLGVSQARVSAIESGTMPATELSTLARYVSALGGTLRVVADFEDDSGHRELYSASPNR
ncbi:MAG: helix-turn-helix transcriptional regulator [Pseudonocardiales bacterium]|nr:helix-turn-helix transcriptional regulator [Pseudonocardiales bacterium]